MDDTMYPEAFCNLCIPIGRRSALALVLIREKDGEEDGHEE